MLRADDRRFAAMQKGDWAGLEAGLAVYARSGDAWRMIAWQSTRVPDA